MPTNAVSPRLGSYFVSAYPPFDFWDEGTLPCFRGKLERQDERLQGLGLYVHIPFCVDRCQYCYYLSYDDRRREIDRYCESVVRELELWAEQPLLADRTVSFAYFGGGTPSLLSEARIRGLLERLQRVLSWSGVREATFECAPRSVARGKLDARKRLGLLFDAGSFSELGALVGGRRTPADALVAAVESDPSAPVPSIPPWA